MNSITSIYIPHVEKHFDAEYIADVFDRNDIAQVSRIFIEPYKSNIKKRSIMYNRAYVEIKHWHETEAAYSFIQRLRNPSVEARIVHSGDDWWSVDINIYPAKFDSKRTLTVFVEKTQYDDESCSAIAVGTTDDFDVYMKELDDGREQWYNDVIKIDAEKTKLLRDIVDSFTERALMLQEDKSDYEAYLEEIEKQRDHLYSQQYNWDELYI